MKTNKFFNVFNFPKQRRDKTYFDYITRNVLKNPFCVLNSVFSNFYQ